MSITGTQIHYYFICQRKLWLFANHITMEATSDLVYEGKLIHENSYQKRNKKYKEIELDGIKIDYYDPVHKIIHEIKKSKKMEKAHEWQLKFYLYVLEQNGISGVKGILEYPEQKKTKEILLTEKDKKVLHNTKQEIENILRTDSNCPGVIHAKICKKCSYHDFCYVSESEEE